MCMTLCTIQWKWRLRDYDSVIKLLCMQRSIRLSKKCSRYVMHTPDKNEDKWYFVWNLLSNNPQICFPGILSMRIFFQRPTVGRWFSSGTPVYSTNKTDRHDLTEILYNVTLDTITRITDINIIFPQDKKQTIKQFYWTRLTYTMS
jgi:hypothetical protein